jgi:hypothetical protein
VEELDLIELTRKAFLKALKNVKGLLLILFVSLTLSVFLFYIVPKRYTTSLTASCGIIRLEAMEQIIQILRLSAKDRDYESLASNLNLSQANSSLIKDIEFVEIRPAITSNSGGNDLFMVQIILSDKMNLNELQVSLLNYINRNENLKQVSTVYMASYQNNLERVNNEITQLETTRKMLLEDNFKSQNYIMMNPSEINERLVSLTRQKNDLVRDITLFSPVRVIQPFNSLSRPSFPRLSYFLLGGLLFGLVGSLIFLVFKN